MKTISAALIGGIVAVVSSAAMQETRPMVTISVDEDAPYTRPHTIVIAPLTHPWARSQEEIDQRVWRAERRSDLGVERMTSEECPALRQVALSFVELPRITIEPAALREFEELIQVPPTMKDGFSTQLEFETYLPSGSSARVTVSQGHEFNVWGHEAVSELLSCWGPLLP